MPVCKFLLLVLCTAFLLACGGGAETQNPADNGAGIHEPAPDSGSDQEGADSVNGTDTGNIEDEDSIESGMGESGSSDVGDAGNADTSLPGGDMPLHGYVIRSVQNTERCFGLDGDLLILSACDTAPNWVFDEQGQLRLLAAPTKCIVADKLDYFSRLSLMDCGQTHQRWRFQSNGFQQADWAIDFDLSNGIPIIYRWHGNDNQRWTGPAVDGQDSTQPEAGDGNNTDTGSEGEQDEGGATEGSAESGSSELHKDWTFRTQRASEPYGRQTFQVRAAQNWVNTGLFLKAGQSANISAAGQWAVRGGAQYSADGNVQGERQRGCAEGQLVARIGLYYSDEQITCVGAGIQYVAPKDGIVFLGAIVSTDLGETYETRKSAVGSLQVTIDSQGATVPTLRANDVYFYDFASVQSGWLEVLGEHTVLTLPAAIAAQDAAVIEQAVQRIDSIYQTHQALRGRVPYHGQPIRWFADTEDAPGWMLAGNPIRMDPALVYADNHDRITRAAEVGNGNWGFAHELGHDFNFAGGDWAYTLSVGLEAWPNIFSVHAQEKLGLSPRNLDCAARKTKYIAGGNYDKPFNGDPWIGLCFLMEFKDRYGWGFYQRFYQQFNQSPGKGWAFLRARFNEAANEDTSSIFNEWKVPAN